MSNFVEINFKEGPVIFGDRHGIICVEGKGLAFVTTRGEGRTTVLDKRHWSKTYDITYELGDVNYTLLGPKEDVTRYNPDIPSLNFRAEQWPMIIDLC